MTSLLLILIGGGLVALALYAVRLQWRVGPMALLAAAICAGLAYNALILGLGRFIGYGSTLEALSAPRFWLLAILVPLTILVAGDLVGRLGIDAARSRNVFMGGWALVIMLILLGIASDASRLNLQPGDAGDVLRYINADSKDSVLPAVMTTLAAIILGMMAWRYAGFVWLFLGGMLMLGGTAAGGVAPWLPVLGQLVLMASVVALLAEVGKREAEEAGLSEATGERST